MAINDLPFVSIVTPSFNSGDFLDQAIQSVITQHYPHLEHIIIDGGSTDNSLDILRRYTAPVVWRSEPDRGQADALNKGFRQARGQIVGWLNADDMYQPGAIQTAVQYLQAHPEVDLVYGNYDFIDQHGNLIHHHQASEFSLERLFYGDAIIPQTSMFFRRYIIDETNGVDAGLHYVMDWEFTLRLAMRYNVKQISETWGCFRITRGTKSVHQPENFWPEIIAVLQKIFQTEDGQRFKAWRNDALFMTYLWAALEFARMNQLTNAQIYSQQAYRLTPQPRKHPAVLASGLYQTAAYPWHSAFTPHPLARQALDNLGQSLDLTPESRRVKGHLYLYRALKALQQGEWRLMSRYLPEAKPILNRQDLFDWRLARMAAGAILKP